MAVSDSLFNTSKIEDLFWASALSLPVAFLTDNHMYKFRFDQILPLASSIRGLGTILGSGRGGQNNDIRMRFFVWIDWNIKLKISRNSRYINTKTEYLMVQVNEGVSFYNKNFVLYQCGSEIQRFGYCTGVEMLTLLSTILLHEDNLSVNCGLKLGVGAM